METHDLRIEGDISDLFIMISTLTMFCSTLQISGTHYGACRWNLSERTSNALSEF